MAHGIITSMRLILLSTIMFFFSSLLVGEEYITIKGYIGDDVVKQAINTIKDENEQVILDINSSSGDLVQVLELAKTLYELKVDRGVKVIVYIDNTAVGPAAILPFVSDDLYTSYFVSWGDITLGTRDEVPTNILRNRVVSLIGRGNPNAKLLTLIAAAMVDDSLTVVDENGWKLVSDPSNKEVISPEGETLVVNHLQLEKLGLVEETLSEDTFEKRYVKLSDEKPEAVVEAPKGLAAQLKEHIKSKDENNKIGYISIAEKKSQISQSTWLYVKSALDYYKKVKPAFIILELNTPGGEVFSSQQISDALKEIDTQHQIPVVAFINNWAISAGAMIAYSCRFITIVKDASMGAAEPVLMGEGGEMKSASEKINSALRTDFANRAGFYDRNPLIAEAMVDKEIVLVMRHGKIVKLEKDSQIRRSGPDPDVVITTKDKLLTLNAKQMMEFGVADILLQPTKIPLITTEERSVGKWPANKMLLFTYPFFEEIPNATVVEYQMDWKTQFFVILATPLVSSLLFMGMLIGFYIEFNTPGFGLPGSIGLTCLFLIALSSFALEIANWLEVIMLLAGLALLAVELFVLPSFGIIGILGILFMLAGMFGMMLPGIGAIDYTYDTQTFNAAGEVFFERLAWFSGTLVVSFFIIILLGKYVLPKVTPYNRFVLAGHEQDAKEGYVAGVDVSLLPAIGSKGEAYATLRPAGKITIDDKIYDAVTDGSFVEKGKEIVVTRYNGSVIVVSKVEETS